MADFSYSPASLTGTVGRAISLDLRNGGQTPHTFTIDGLVESGNMNPGQTMNVSFTPTQAGTLVYYCRVHGRAAMSGELRVTAAGGLAPDNVPVDSSTSAFLDTVSYDYAN
jgi:plastocyanin